MSDIVEYPEKAEELGFLINQEREKLGLNPLYTFAYLKECANIRAKESSEYFSHTRPDGSSYTSVLDYSIIPWAYIGENLAGGKEDARDTLEQWRNSPKHWEILTRPEYTHIGCAACYNPDGDSGYCWYWCTICTNEWDLAVYDGQYLPEYSGNSAIGAFENAVNLQKIIVPESVVKIGGKSFAGTKLKAVKIAKNCEYSAASFPEDCVIDFY